MTAVQERTASLRATVLAPALGQAILKEFDAADPASRFAGSHAWTRAAMQALGSDRVVYIGFENDDGDTVGCAAFETGTSGWRSGSPRTSCLRWPMAGLGYGFRPRFRPETCNAVRSQWLSAVLAVFEGWRVELLATAPDVATAEAPCLERRDGASTWCGTVPASPEAWYGSLVGRYRRDLRKYRRDIGKAGATWLDHVSGANPESMLEVCFELHGRRVQHKGQTSGYLERTHRDFLECLVHGTSDDALRATLLLDGTKPMGGCISFAYGGWLEVYMPGFDMEYGKLDLGRQLIHHQILNEFENDDGFRGVDLLGGDLPYKREFGLEPVPTQDLVVHPTAGSSWREGVVRGVIDVYRTTRGVVFGRGRP